MINERAKAILEFCFIKTPLEQWFKKDDQFDNILKSTFMDDYISAINNEYDNWRNDAEACVALIILLDQLSRNFYRNNSKAYDQDIKSILIVKEAINKQFLNKTGGSYPKDFIYSQDYALILRFLLKSKIYVLPNILTKSRVSNNNMTNSNSLKLTREKEMIKNNFFSYKNFDLSLKEKIFFHFLILKRVLKYTLKLIL